jgi:uncharacterized membrane protein YadS
MDSTTIAFGLMTLTLAGVAWHARRLGNDRRDVALLGAFSGLCGVGAAVAAVI